MLREDVILVDAADTEIGVEEKLEAHRRGELHRAFSVMVWDSHDRLLLQRRQIGKYHSGGLWTNSCCGHPRPGETPVDAATRRLMEEMRVPCRLSPIGTFVYRAELDAGLTEHEFVHLFHGRYDGAVAPDPIECDGYSWSDIDVVRRQVMAVPQSFSVWFKKYLDAGWPLKLPQRAVLSSP